MKKLIKKSFHRKEKGFTLIELLIVIVIIGILAGVLIAVINPVRQQNRARNASVKAALLKSAFAINAVRAGMGTLPNNGQLPQELENFVINSSSGVGVCDLTSTTLDCEFTISGTQMPILCSTDHVVPSVTTNGQECQMHVVSVGSSLMDGQFRIAAATFPLQTSSSASDWSSIYVFDSSAGLKECDYNGAQDYDTPNWDPLNVDCTSVQ